jgi:hypothetical protein
MLILRNANLPSWTRVGRCLIVAATGDVKSGDYFLAPMAE